MRVCMVIVALAAMCAAFPQGAARAQVQSPPAAGALGDASVDDLLGRDVLNRQGERLAHVGGVLVEGGRIAYLILHIREERGTWRRVPVPASAAEWRASQPVVVDLEKRVLVDAPACSPDEGADFSDLEWERRIHSYYGEKAPERAKESYMVISR